MIKPAFNNDDFHFDPDWVVVDVGGAMNPLERANYVVDILPYHLRKVKEAETFNKSTWIQLDFGGSVPYKLPFEDKTVDFVWCQQTLEDIANPFELMREIIRIGKAGFIEIPSRILESTIDIDSNRFTGFCHHRWYGELEKLNYDEYEFVMTHKSPYVYSEELYFKQFPLGKSLLGFVWYDSFKFKERLLLYKDDIIQDIQDYFYNRSNSEFSLYGGL